MTVVRLLAFAAIMLASGSATAQLPPAAGAQMPDPKAMSGMPLPTSDLPPGTLTVRVVLGAVDKPIAGVTVEITGGVRKETGENGRVEFTGLQPGTTIKAFTEVGGERLESQDIRLPTNGGVRVMLVATDPELEQRAAQDRKLAEGPAQRGTVVIGGDSRFVFELGDQGLSVFNLLQILNTARVPIDPGGPTRVRTTRCRRTSRHARRLLQAGHGSGKTDRGERPVPTGDDDGAVRLHDAVFG